MLFLETGCTLDEITKIRPVDFEFTTSSIAIGKYGKKRKVRLSLNLSLQLNSYMASLAREPCLFSISKQRIITIVRAKTALQNKPLTPKELRKISLQRHYSLTKSGKLTKAGSGLKNLQLKLTLTPSQIEIFRSSISSEKDRIIFDLLCETGCNLKQLTSMKVQDIDMENQTVHIQSDTSATRERTIRITHSLCSRIKDYSRKLPAQSNLFRSRQSQKISDKRIFQIIKSYSKKTGIKVNPQILRNTYIANTIKQGLPEHEVCKITGIQTLRFDQYGLMGAS
jgi:integrase